MAATKLTLRLDEEVIALGKDFAKRKGTSLSKMVEQFILECTASVEKPLKVIEPDPALGALFGPSAQYSFSDISINEMREDYYSSILAREQVEEE